MINAVKKLELTINVVVITLAIPNPCRIGSNQRLKELVLLDHSTRRTFETMEKAAEINVRV